MCEQTGCFFFFSPTSSAETSRRYHQANSILATISRALLSGWTTCCSRLGVCVLTHVCVCVRGSRTPASHTNTHTHSPIHMSEKLSLLYTRLRSESQLDFAFAITLSGRRYESVIHLFIASCCLGAGGLKVRRRMGLFYTFGLMLTGYSSDSAYSALSLPPSRFCCWIE